jgi:ankyrin repeat protein
MQTISKYILESIFRLVGPWNDLLNLCLVCKRFKSILESQFHNFTLQGIRSPKSLPSNVRIDPILARFKSGWKLFSLDLRNVEISVSSLSEVLLLQPGLRKLDLSNTHLSVGQVWSSIQTNKPKDPLLLEELRLTNNRTVYLGYEALFAAYPGLLRLYVGNTLTILDNFRFILSKFDKLQLLDVSLCNIDYYDMAHIDFREILQNSQLQTLFISEINEAVVDTFLSLNIEIVESTIGDLLKSINTEENLIELEDWLRVGGDVNLECNMNHKLCKELSTSPQITVIKRLTDESLLREMFKLLLFYDLDVSHHVSDESSACSLLTAAIQMSQTGLAHLLIANGADISPTSASGEQPAMTLAAAQGSVPILQLFLDFNLHSIDCYFGAFCNPICTAAIRGDTDIFMFLIEQGVPLFACSVHHNILITSKQVLELALSPEHRDFFTFPAEMLYEAAQYYVAHMMVSEAKLVIENLENKVKDEEAQILEAKREYSMRIRSEMHKPLLILAIERKMIEVIRILVEKGFDINGEDMHGWTGFIAACSYGYCELIPYLCDNGALVNKRDKWWRTALHQAAQNGHTDVVRELIRYGAALSPEDFMGWTPLNYAIINRRKEAEVVLREHGAKCANIRKKCSIF